MKECKDPFSFVPEKRRYLLYADGEGMPALSPILEKLIEKRLPFDLKFEISADDELTNWLSGQKMGCYFYGVSNCNRAIRLEQLVKDAGFSDEEMQIIGIGKPIKNVFCSRCHMIQPAENQSKIDCINCGLHLTVSEHYSAYHHAYLGYPS